MCSFSINGGFDGFIPTTPPDDCYTSPVFDPPVGAVDWSVPAWRFTADAAIQTRITDSAATTLQVQLDPTLANARRGFFLTYVGTFNEWHEGTAFEPAKNLADLLPPEAAFGYHNPVDGTMKLEALREILSQILAPNAVVRPPCTCALVRFDMIMCSAIFLRMTDMGTTSPGVTPPTGCIGPVGAGMAGAGAAGAAAAAGA